LIIIWQAIVGQEISYGLESFSQAEAQIYRTLFLYGKQSLRSAVSTVDRFYLIELLKQHKADYLLVYAPV
jgi:hypothetical protein